MSSFYASLDQGQCVRISGLTARPELNGRVGTARRFDAEKQRWEVWLENEAGGITLLVRPERLLPCPEGDFGVAATPEEAAASLAACPIDSQHPPLPSGAEAEDGGGSEFLAACDETGDPLSYGNWWHRQAPPGEASYDLCDAAYQRLPPSERARYVRITCLMDVHQNFGPPPTGDDAIHVSEESATFDSPPDAAGGAAEDERAREAVESLLRSGGECEIRTADVLLECARLERLALHAAAATTPDGAGDAAEDGHSAVRGAASPSSVIPTDDASVPEGVSKDEPPSLEMARVALIGAAKRTPGLHFRRCGDDPRDCVLSSLPLGQLAEEGELV